MSENAAIARIRKSLVYVATNYTWGFVAAIGIAITSSLFSIRYISTLENTFSEMYEEDIKGQNYVQGAYLTLLNIESKVKDLKAGDDEKGKDESIASIRKNIDTMQYLIAKAIPTFYSTRSREIVAKSKKDTKSFLAQLAGLLETAKANAAIEKEVLEKIGSQEGSLKSDLATLNDIKRSNSGRLFKSIKLQLDLSLAVTVLMLIGTVLIRAFMYIKNKDRGRRGGHVKNAGTQSAAAEDAKEEGI